MEAIVGNPFLQVRLEWRAADYGHESNTRATVHPGYKALQERVGGH
jgi:hypothetical protein